MVSKAIMTKLKTDRYKWCNSIQVTQFEGSMLRRTNFEYPLRDSYHRVNKPWGSCIHEWKLGGGTHSLPGVFVSPQTDTNPMKVYLFSATAVLELRHLYRAAPSCVTCIKLFRFPSLAQGKIDVSLVSQQNPRFLANFRFSWWNGCVKL